MAINYFLTNLQEINRNYIFQEVIDSHAFEKLQNINTVKYYLSTLKLNEKIIEKNYNLDIRDLAYYSSEEFLAKEIRDADILYMTRVQKERFSDLMEYERVKNVYILRNDMLKGAKPNMKIMHPLPRVNEIAYDVDDSEHAYYIQQARNGLFAREAIYSYCLGITLDDIKNDTTIINSKF